MGRRINVNWAQLQKLSSETRENSEEFEQIRLKMLEVILSIDECWKGPDAQNFIRKAVGYVNGLKKETNKLTEWSEYFNKSAMKYNGGVEDGIRSVRDFSREFDIVKDEVI